MKRDLCNKCLRSVPNLLHLKVCIPPYKFWWTLLATGVGNCWESADLQGFFFVVLIWVWMFWLLGKHFWCWSSGGTRWGLRERKRGPRIRAPKGVEVKILALQSFVSNEEAPYSLECLNTYISQHIFGASSTAGGLCSTTLLLTCLLPISSRKESKGNKK